ncbi:MAG: tetratricopeptide repeat protein [Chlorobiaceae bacterium]|nr:tetratricopeptide repeat protein [Chlorobiaceae bacterium]
MKPLKEVAGAYLALSDAQRQLLESNYDDAAANCRKAMEISRTMPPEEAFDHAGFDAFCHAGLAEALAGLGSFDEALRSADKALHHFNRRGELNQDEGKLWISAVYSRALALDGLGRAEEAAPEFRKTIEMIDERKGETPGKERMKEVAAARITKIGASNQHKKPGYKAWWEFWS